MWRVIVSRPAVTARQAASAIPYGIEVTQQRFERVPFLLDFILSANTEASQNGEERVRAMNRVQEH